MTLKLLTERHLEFPSLKGGYTGWSESTHVKCHIVVNHMPQLICTTDQETQTKYCVSHQKLSFLSANRTQP